MPGAGLAGIYPYGDRKESDEDVDDARDAVAAPYSCAFSGQFVEVDETEVSAGSRSCRVDEGKPPPGEDADADAAPVPAPFPVSVEAPTGVSLTGT